MKIRLCQHEIDNGNIICKDCVYSDSDERIINGCSHPILYDEQGNIIEEVELQICDCIESPKNCILFKEIKN